MSIQKEHKWNEKSKIYFIIGCVLIVAMVIYMCFKPQYTFDSAWYISYLDYFDNTKPITEWFSGRGFMFPLILWIAYTICPGDVGIQIVFGTIYFLFCIYSFRLTMLIKREKYQKELSIGDIAIVCILLFNPIIWGYFHFVLTECICLALLWIYLFYSLKFYFKRKTNKSIKRDYVYYVIFSCIMTIVCWFVKQSFFANTIFVAMLLEIFYFIYLPKAKKIMFALLLMFCMIGTLKSSLIIWNQFIEVSDDTYAGGLANRIALLRYFYPENSIYAETSIISVRSDEWEEIDSFEYKFENSLTNRLEFVWKCLNKNPERVIKGYIDNYLLMADVYGNPAYLDQDYYIWGAVSKNNVIDTINGTSDIRNAAAENRSLIQGREKSIVNYNLYFDGIKDLLNSVGGYTDKIKVYGQNNSTNCVIQIMGNKLLWNVTMYFFAILVISAPWIAFICVILFFINKNRTNCAIYGTLLLYGWGYIMMHVLTGQPIDRYAFPAYGAFLLVFVSMCIDGMGYIRIQRCKEKMTKKRNDGK